MNNFYAAPKADRAPNNPYMPGPPVASRGFNYEETRRAHIAAEANIRSVGMLSIIGGVLYVLGGVFAFGGSLLSGADEGMGMAMAISGGLAFVGVLCLFCGIAIRKLQPVGRIIYTLFAALGIVTSVPDLMDLEAAEMTGTLIGLAINLAILALMWGRHGKVIFTEHYREHVVPATPHVKHTSILAWVLLGLILLVVVAAIIGSL